MTPQIVSEIEQAVTEQGSLTKAQIVETWELHEMEYADLRLGLLARGRVEAGPPRIGGFRSKPQRGPLPTEYPDSDGILREQWEDHVVARLVEFFQHHELEELLGDLAYTVRQSRVSRGQESRRGTKAELASALVIQHGIDLLANTVIRGALARACKTNSPKRWHPGKGAALEFVQALGLPLVLAGLPSDESPPSVEYLDGRLSLPPLEDFQDEVRQEFLFGITSRGHRSIVTLPTGAGKTRVAVQGIRNWLYSQYDPQVTVTRGAAVLWLAHTEELCEQACACFRQVWHGSDSVAPLVLIRFWGGHTQDLASHKDTIRRAFESPSVLVSTPQRLVSLLDRVDDEAKTLVALFRSGLGLLIVDEAHRAAAPSYRKILREAIAEDVPVVGLTATPFRMEYRDDDPQAGTRELTDIFRNLIEPVKTLGTKDPRGVLERRGILARPEFRTIASGDTQTRPLRDT